MNLKPRCPDLRSRRAALTDDAALGGGFGLLAAALLPADVRASAAHLDVQTWAALGLGLGVVASWPGPRGHRAARTLLSAALLVVPAVVAPLDLGAALHWPALDGTLLGAAPLTGVCGGGLLALALWGRRRLGGGVWRRQRDLLRLGRALPGWQLSRRVDTGAWNRVIRGPDGSALTTLHVAYGHERGRDVRRVTWPVPTEHQLSARPWPGHSVLWVTLPARRRDVVYEQEHWPGGVTWPATASELAGWLQACSGAGAVRAETAPHRPRRADRLRRPARVLSAREVLAAGAQVWRDVPGLFNGPGGVRCTPHPTPELPSGVFTLERPGAAAVTVGVWPHPDLPSAQHADQHALNGLSGLRGRPVIWAPLLPAGAAVPAHWTVGGPQVLLRTLETHWGSGAPQPPGAGPHASPAPETAQWSGSTDPYQVLGVPRTASPEEIRRAWRRLALQWHPDRTQRLSPSEREAAQTRFRAIHDAYRHLNSPGQGA